MAKKKKGHKINKNRIHFKYYGTRQSAIMDVDRKDKNIQEAI